MKRWLIILLAVMSCALGACTTTRMSKSGATTDDFERDEAECTRQSRVWGLFSIESRYKECMLNHGYRMH